MITRVVFPVISQLVVAIITGMGVKRSTPVFSRCHRYPEIEGLGHESK